MPWFSSIQLSDIPGFIIAFFIGMLVFNIIYGILKKIRKLDYFKHQYEIIEIKRVDDVPIYSIMCKPFWSSFYYVMEGKYNKEEITKLYEQLAGKPYAYLPLKY